MARQTFLPEWTCDLCGCKKTQYSDAMPDYWRKIKVVYSDSYQIEYEICAVCSPIAQGNDHFRDTAPKLIGNIISKLKRTEPQAATLLLNEDTLDILVNRFLAWPLPKEVCADPCASMSNYDGHRSGTTLLTATQTKQMLRHILMMGVPNV